MCTALQFMWDARSSLPPLRRGVKLGLLRVGVTGTGCSACVTCSAASGRAPYSTSVRPIGLWVARISAIGFVILGENPL
jgi:hypothetical protein